MLGAGAVIGLRYVASFSRSGLVATLLWLGGGYGANLCCSVKRAFGCPAILELAVSAVLSADGVVSLTEWCGLLPRQHDSGKNTDNPPSHSDLLTGPATMLVAASGSCAGRST